MIRILTPALTVFFMHAATISLQAQAVEQRLDSFYRAKCMKGQLNGNVLVAEGDHILFSKSFGFANMRDSLRNNDQTEFNLASISKTFTSAAVLQLVEKKKIGLDEPLTRYIESFPFAGISIRNLLNHTSGLPDEDDLFDSVLNKDPDLILTNADLIPALINYHHPLNFKPGDKWEYCNLNYFL